VSDSTARRSDAGRPRLTTRDAQALGWLEGQYAICETDVGVLLSRIGGGQPPSLPGVQRILRRWHELGYVEVGRFPRGPRLVWLSHGRPRELGWSKLPHAAAESRARLWLEQVPSTIWIGEYELVPTGYLSRAQLLDGMLLVGPEHARIGVEVELSAKSIYRVRRRLATLQHEPHLAALLYLVAEDEGERPIRKVLEETEDEIRARDQAYGATNRLLPVVVEHMPTSPTDRLPDAIKELLTCPPAR
jgi:hypothetical protein